MSGPLLAGYPILVLGPPPARSVPVTALALAAVAGVSGLALPARLSGPIPATWPGIGLAFFLGLFVGPPAALGSVVALARYGQQGGRRAVWWVGAVVVLLSPEIYFLARFILDALR